MSQWGKNDTASNSVLWGVTGFNKTPNTTNQTAFYGNTTQDAFVTGLIAGQFGVDTTEMGVGSGNVAQVIITTAGTGYGATVSSVITNGGGTGANVSFSSTAGRLTSATINNPGSSYETNPTITIPAPPLRIFNGNTAVTPNSSIGAFLALTTANSIFSVGDRLTYAGNTTSTPVGLTDNTKYFVSFANTTGLKLSATLNGANLNFAKASGDNTTAGGATLIGDTAAATAVVGGAANQGVQHAGWVVRTVGTGGRAGRVQYETLVAMGSITGDGSDDPVLPDA